MKHRNKILMAVAIMVIFASCARKDDAVLTSASFTRFNATLEESDVPTKTTISEVSGVCHVLWKQGDEISVNGKKYTADNTGAETVFTAVSDPASGTEFKAYYPSSMVGEGGITTLPAIQTYGGDSVISNVPTYAVSTTSTLSFKSLCGVLAVKVEKSDIKQIKALKVSSDQPMCGEFEITEESGVTYAKLKNSATETCITLVSDRVIDIKEGGNIFYLAVPAGTYQNIRIGLSCDGENFSQTMATKTDADIQIERNKVHAFNYKVNSIVFAKDIDVQDQL